MDVIFGHRNCDHNPPTAFPDIPGIQRAGWDSGWDNSTVSGGEVENEAPELQAYLILQMKTLARWTPL